VWVSKASGLHISNALLDLLKEASPTKWTLEDVKDSKTKEKRFDSSIIDDLLAPVPVQSPHPEIPIATRNSEFTNREPPFTATGIRDDFTNRERTPFTYELASQFTPVVTSDGNNRITSDTRPFHCNSTTDYSRQLTSLAKMYSGEKDKQYSREDNNFNRKLNIFQDMCDKIDLPDAARGRGFSTMLRGLALDFYYENKKLYITLEGMCTAIRNHFKGPEYQRKQLVKFSSTTLISIISKNKDKGTEECLDLLFNNLRHLQHRLEPNLRNDSFLYTQLINAY